MAITLALNGSSVLTGEPEFDESEYAKQDWLNNAKKVKKLVFGGIFVTVWLSCAFNR